MKNILLVLIIIAAIFALFLWLIGPNWRAFLSNPPTGTDVLFWSKKQRTNGFRLLDGLPMLVKSRTISAGSTVRPLEQGATLELELDPDTFMEQQNTASLIVLHKGKIRLERYKLRFNESGRWTSFSVAKSITSTLVGAALKDGAINSLDDKVSDYVKGLNGSAYDDVTLAQLLTMTSGVAWNEDYEDPNSDVATFSNQVPEDGLSSLVTYLRKLPRAHPPGEVWNYSTGETNLVGILVSEATGKTLSDYLSEKIWKPYGMQQNATWLLGDSGEEMSGCCIQASTRDFARFAQFILKSAKINETSIVPEGWLEQATKNQADTGSDEYGYGYQWWTFPDGSFTGIGIFGQGLFIDPNRELVIVSNSSWSTATGEVNGEDKARMQFYEAVQDAIDNELAAN